MSNPVTTTTTPDLMVSKDVSRALAFGAGVWDTVKRDTKPIIYTTSKFTIMQMEAQGGGGDHIKPISSMRQTRGAS